MSVVGNNLGRNGMMAVKTASAPSSSLSKGKAKESFPTSTSSGDFEKFLNQKQEKPKELRPLARENQPAQREAPEFNALKKKDSTPSSMPVREVSTKERAAEPLRAPDEKQSGLPENLEPINDQIPGASEAPGFKSQLPISEKRMQLGTELQSRASSAGQDESVDNLVHRQALQQLLKKMKEEFGLNAEEIVQAFSQLTSQELQLPPELTLDKIVQALPLNPEQQVLAKAYFQDMLKQTAAQDMAGYLKASHRQLSLEVLSQREVQKRAMTRAVENMQSQFFTQPLAQQKVQANPNALARYQAQQLDPATDSASESTDGVDWQALGMEAVPQDSFAAPTVKASESMMTPQAVEGSPADFASAQIEQKTAQATEGKAKSFFFDQSLKGQAAYSSGPISPKAVVPEAKITDVAPSVPNLNLVSQESPSTQSENSASENGENQNFDQSEFQSNFLQNSDKSQGPQSLKSQDSFIINTQPTNSEEARNIRQVINEAQVLARRGGGEMKVILAPEGLGQIKMKVAVEHGQVSIEMVADSNEAKKMIEKGLGELKATLISHNLKVDQIRVDTPADVSRQLTQQHDEAQRQFAQQFMEQFRQDNNEFRRGFFEMGSAQPIRSQREESERRPIVSNNKSRSNGSRRLDLVA